MKYGTDRFIGDGVQSGLNHPKNIERKTITGRVAGEAAKLNSYFRMKYWKYAVCHYLNYRKQAMGNYWKSNIMSGRVGAETAKSGF